MQKKQQHTERVFDRIKWLQEDMILLFLTPSLSYNQIIQRWNLTKHGFSTPKESCIVGIIEL